jgi:ankyrin repeat protein
MTKLQSRRIVVGCAATLLLTLAGLNFGAAARSDVADAMMNGNKAEVSRLLAQKADVNAPQVDGTTAIHWAVFNNDVATFDQLIAAGAKVKVANREGVTPLAMASLYGNTSMVTKLLKAGADAKERGVSGETMLMLAARNGNPDTVKALIAAGAEVNAKESLRGTTALMWAAEQSHPAAVKALLDAKADYTLKSAVAGVPRAYMANQVNVATVQAAQARLAAEKAGVAPPPAPAGGGGRGGGNNRNAAGGAGAANGQNAPGVAPPLPGTNAAAGGFGGGQQGAGGNRGGNRGGNGANRGGAAAPAAAAADAAADDGGDDAAGPIAGATGNSGGGLTALIFASRQGDLESAKLLLAAGADINQPSDYGWTPLLTATQNRHYILGKYLMERGADVNLANKSSWTNLYLATDNRNIEGGDFPVPKADMDSLEYIRALLDHKADVNAQIRENTLTRTIFTMQWLFERGATPFLRASQSSDTALMKLLLERGANPKIATDYGDTALSAAAGIGWVEGVTYEWSKEENYQAIKMLLDLGLDPNGANNDGRTPLMGAALKGRNDVIQLLVDRGAKLETRDKGSRDTDKLASKLAGHTWQAVDYAEGLVRVGVQSAVLFPDTAKLLRKLMMERGLEVPAENRNVDSICVVDGLCKDVAK